MIYERWDRFIIRFSYWQRKNTAFLLSYILARVLICRDRARPSLQRSFRPRIRDKGREEMKSAQKEAPGKISARIADRQIFSFSSSIQHPAIKSHFLCRLERHNEGRKRSLLRARSLTAEACPKSLSRATLGKKGEIRISRVRGHHMYEPKEVEDL
jgi:hypothetical protein